MSETDTAYQIISQSSRVRLLHDAGARLTAKEAAVLLGAGALAAALVAWLPLPLRVPGHAILKAAVPIILGVGAVPRPCAGSVAGMGAAGMLALLLATGLGRVPAAAATALLAIGPAIDLAILTIASERFSVYVRFAIAGLSANLLAFFVRWGMAAFGVEEIQPHRMGHLGVAAFLSFGGCGIVAGLLSAVVFFRNHVGQPEGRREQ